MAIRSTSLIHQLQQVCSRLTRSPTSLIQALHLPCRRWFSLLLSAVEIRLGTARWYVPNAILRTRADTTAVAHANINGYAMGARRSTLMMRCENGLIKSSHNSVRLISIPLTPALAMHFCPVLLWKPHYSTTRILSHPHRQLSIHTDLKHDIFSSQACEIIATMQPNSNMLVYGLTVGHIRLSE